MDQLTYEKLAEVNGRWDAEMIESLLEAEGIDVELVQESVGHTTIPVTVDGLGRVQIFVPKDKVPEAREWLKTYRNGIQEE
ncbi:MAG TPA: DUF2007 domain-containing protein [Anaerolineales bacterium]